MKEWINTGSNVVVMHLNLATLANDNTICIRAFFRGLYVKVWENCTIASE